VRHIAIFFTATAYCTQVTSLQTRIAFSTQYEQLHFVIAINNVTMTMMMVIIIAVVIVM